MLQIEIRRVIEKTNKVFRQQIKRLNSITGDWANIDINKITTDSYYLQDTHLISMEI